MPRFHFHLRARGVIHWDPEGTDLPDLASAREHGCEVARELMRHRQGAWCWSLYVEEDEGKQRLDLYFADIDPSLDACSPQTRMLIGETCRNLSELTEVLSALRATRLQSAMLLARARGKPQLAYARCG